MRISIQEPYWLILFLHFNKNIIPTERRLCLSVWASQHVKQHLCPFQYKENGSREQLKDSFHNINEKNFKVFFSVWFLSPTDVKWTQCVLICEIFFEEFFCFCSWTVEPRNCLKFRWNWKLKLRWNWKLNRSSDDRSSFSRHSFVRLRRSVPVQPTKVLQICWQNSVAAGFRATTGARTVFSRQRWRRFDARISVTLCGL